MTEKIDARDKNTGASDQNLGFKGGQLTKSFSGRDGRFEYELKADWMTLHKDEKPSAKMFYFSYTKKGDGNRPICFAFNGGPGASSVYLHLGALGPQRIDFNEDGSLPAPPFHLVENKESWLEFTDLVFIDPIGTGFSRIIEGDGASSEQSGPAGKSAEKKTGESSKKIEKDEYYKQNRDLESISEFMEKYLSQEKRWSSKVFLAGESYGGYRVAKLARLAQERFGISLSGIFAISPAFEFNLLNYSDTNVLPWLDVLPSLVASAIHHRKSKKSGELSGEFSSDLSALEAELEKTESFAIGPFLQSLVLGEAFAERESVFQELSDRLGLSLDYVKMKNGRVSFFDFARQLLKKDCKVLGIYDGSTSGYDPFPDRDTHMAPDPSLAGIEGMFRSGIQNLISEVLGGYVDRSYRLLSMEVNESWKSDEKKHYFDLNIGATEDLRFALSLNPNMKIYVLHGLYDLVTPYFSSKRLIQQLPLNKDLRKQIVLKNFLGGHMFYSWKKSREEFRDLAADAVK